MVHVCQLPYVRMEAHLVGALECAFRYRAVLVAAACRGLIERNITAVAQGRRTKEEVLSEAVQCFRAAFMIAAQQQGMPCIARGC